MTKLTLTKLQKEILIGCILGDLHIEQSLNGQTARLVFEHSIKQKAYMQHLYFHFKDWVPGELSIKNRNRNGRISQTLVFKTRYDGVFRFYRKQFYNSQGVKIISRLIHRLLTPIALAYWYMDDGSIKSKQSKGVLLNTHSFSKNEIDLLCSILTDKFNLKCKPRQQKHEVNNQLKIYYQIYISGYSYDILRQLIFFQLLPEMHYKFPSARKK